MERADYETTRAITRKSGARPRSDEKPYLVGITGEHACRFFPLQGLRELTIGRTSDCEIPIILDDIVSRRHARVEMLDEGEVRLVDLQSTNGTLVNGREITSATLHRGDRIFLGQQTIFKFDFFADEERANWEQAAVDALTELMNRGFFDARLAEYFTLHASLERPLSLIVLDVDHFKAVNDQNGHQAGDYALQQVAATISDELDRADIGAIPCRIGGEEFGVIVPSCDEAACARIAEALRGAVAEAILEFEGIPLRITISCGTATLQPRPRNYETPEQVHRAADAAMYRAKNAGRNRVVSA